MCTRNGRLRDVDELTAHGGVPEPGDERGQGSVSGKVVAEGCRGEAWTVRIAAAGTWMMAFRSLSERAQTTITGRFPRPRQMSSWVSG